MRLSDLPISAATSLTESTALTFREISVSIRSRRCSMLMAQELRVAGYCDGAVDAVGGGLEFLPPLQSECDTSGTYVACALYGINYRFPYLHFSECRKYGLGINFFHLSLCISMFICNFTSAKLILCSD